MENNVGKIKVLDDFNASLKEKRERAQKKDQINSIIETLTKRLDASPAEVIDLRNQSKSLFEVADIIEKFAEKKENEKKKEVNKDEVEKIKQVLLEALGIRAEFVDILLSKGSPEELKSAASTIRKEAQARKERAEQIQGEHKRKIEKQIADAQNIAEQMTEIQEQTDVSYMKFLAEHRDYLKRLEAEMPLQQMLLEQVRKEEMKGNF